MTSNARASNRLKPTLLLEPPYKRQPEFPLAVALVSSTPVRAKEENEKWSALSYLTPLGLNQRSRSPPATRICTPARLHSSLHTSLAVPPSNDIFAIRLTRILYPFHHKQACLPTSPLPPSKQILQISYDTLHASLSSISSKCPTILVASPCLSLPWAYNFLTPPELTALQSPRPRPQRKYLNNHPPRKSRGRIPQTQLHPHRHQDQSHQPPQIPSRSYPLQIDLRAAAALPTKIPRHPPRVLQQTTRSTQMVSTMISS